MYQQLSAYNGWLILVAMYRASFQKYVLPWCYFLYFNYPSKCTAPLDLNFTYAHVQKATARNIYGNAPELHAHAPE